MSESIEVIRAPQVVYVYEAPVRLWHWVNALAILVLGVTGYFIGSPLPSLPGEASHSFLMGYIRFAHFAAGYVLAPFFVQHQQHGTGAADCDHPGLSQGEAHQGNIGV